MWGEGVVLLTGYGGGMSSAKAALESDTRVLAYEAGRKFQIRVNTISAGPLGSRAAKAIGFIEDMIRFDPYHFVIFFLLMKYTLSSFTVTIRLVSACVRTCSSAHQYIHGACIMH